MVSQHVESRCAGSVCEETVHCCNHPSRRWVTVSLSFSENHERYSVPLFDFLAIEFSDAVQLGQRPLHVLRLTFVYVLKSLGHFLKV